MDLAQSHRLLPLAPRLVCPINRNQIQRDIANSSSVHPIESVSSDYYSTGFLLPIVDRTNQTEDFFYNQIAAIVANGSNFTTKCDKCVASTNVMHEAAISQPVSVITDLLIRICTLLHIRNTILCLLLQGNLTHFSIYAATCQSEFSGVGGLGPYWAQL